jgi:hypothetical protein
MLVIREATTLNGHNCAGSGRRRDADSRRK